MSWRVVGWDSCRLRARQRCASGIAAVVGIGAVVGFVAARIGPAAAAAADPSVMAFDDPTGQVHTLNVNGALDLQNPFFQDLGTNGRRCVTCHQPASAWTVTPAHLQARFDSSQGTDPIFRPSDGSNCAGATPHSLAEAQAAYSLLLKRGLIRIELDVPPDAEFDVIDVSDPNGCGAPMDRLSLYRRPLPVANLRFLAAVMWDGRESTSAGRLADLAHQATTATRIHAQAAQDLTPEQAGQIVEFEDGLFAAQARDARAGNLNAQGATGGPLSLRRQPFFVGINDAVGLNPTGAVFDPRVFSIFGAWTALPSSVEHDPTTAARLAIARGEAIFNTRRFTISGVGGLNGVTFTSGVSVPDAFLGTCSLCHNSPNAGGRSVKVPVNIGAADPARAPYLPVYTLRNLTTQQAIRTTDPGRAMITGKWADIGKFKGPTLRALAARAPYFHNGSAAALEEVVDFYNMRFNIGLTAREKTDLVAFLRAL